MVATRFARFRRARDRHGLGLDGQIAAQLGHVPGGFDVVLGDGRAVSHPAND